MHILGEVKGKNAIIVDDLIATGSSLIEAVDALKKAKTKNIYAAISHGVLSGPAIKRVDNCKDLKELLITDSISLDENKKHLRVKVLSVAPLLGEAIKRIHNEESVSSLFD
jgi:ribose-phosphate pyrophosphokinase